MDAFQTTSASAETLGTRIATARESAAMSQKDMARRMAVAVSTVKNWETDRSEPRSNMLLMLAQLLNVAPTWLLNGSGEAPVRISSDVDLDALRHNLLDIRGQTKTLLDRIDRILADL